MKRLMFAITGLLVPLAVWTAAAEVREVTMLDGEGWWGVENFYGTAMPFTATTRRVILPPGTWTADDGKVYDGPATVEIAAPLSRLPHFVLK